MGFVNWDQTFLPPYFQEFADDTTQLGGRSLHPRSAKLGNNAPLRVSVDTVRQAAKHVHEFLLSPSPDFVPIRIVPLGEAEKEAGENQCKRLAAAMMTSKSFKILLRPCSLFKAFSLQTHPLSLRDKVPILAKLHDKAL